MYIISTANLVPIIALVSPLAVVVQAAATPKSHSTVPYCSNLKQAQAETCKDWWLRITTDYSEDTFKHAVVLYNNEVNAACTNLVKGETVRAFLL